MAVREKAAAKSPFYVHLLEGFGGREIVDQLTLNPQIQLTDSPRHASILLLAGRFPDSLHAALQQVHDQVPEPRAVMHLDHSGSRSPLPGAGTVDGDINPVDAVQHVEKILKHRRQATFSPLGLQENPVKWKGVGPHGQGGEGMMGGNPYGRGMAMTDDDIRDGLELGMYHMTLGPFLSWLPTGLRLEMALQGDVIQSLRPLVPKDLENLPRVSIFQKALEEAVPVAALEEERARHHLRIVSSLLHNLGMDGFARQVLEWAADPSISSVGKVKGIKEQLSGSWLFAIATRKLGVLPPELIETGGPNARAGGVRTDAREEDPAYQDLEFSIITQNGSDVKARALQRLEEAIQAMELAERAGDRLRQPGPTLEGLHGPEETGERKAWVSLLEKGFCGMAWDSFVPSFISIDADLLAIPPSDAFDEADDPERGREDSDHHHH